MKTNRCSDGFELGKDEKRTNPASSGNMYPLEILLAEDNPINQKISAHLCRKLGDNMDLAENGLEALAKLQQKNYDVILMDIEMPKMDGIEATRQIVRELPPHQRPYIIAVTANNITADRERCLAAGMDEYLNKPLRLDQLIEVLNTVRESRKMDQKVA